MVSEALVVTSLMATRYVKDILARTPGNTDQVTIRPNAEWSAGSAQQDKGTPGVSSATLDDDLEISEVAYINGRQLHTPNRSIPSTATPTTVGASRESSSLPRGAASVSNKRPAAVVVDLTLSSDEEDGPPPIKKPYLALPGRSGPNHYY